MENIEAKREESEKRIGQRKKPKLLSESDFSKLSEYMIYDLSLAEPNDLSHFKRSIRYIEFYCGCIVFNHEYTDVCNEHNACISLGDEW